MIIDVSYFTGKINLPQVGNTEGEALVQGFINDYEPEYLQNVLGYDLWKAFTESDQTAQRWINLLDGDEFVLNGETHKWPGFETKPSPIAQYVYGKFLESEAESVTLVGTATAKTTNAVRTDPSAKIAAAWNDMVLLNHLLAGYLNTNAAVYPEWKTVDYYWGRWYRHDAWYNWWGYWGCDNVNDVYKFKNRYGI